MSETVRTTDGLDLAVYERGSGPTVVLVHGYPDNHSVWDGVAEVLAESFHVVQYDVRGTGASDAPPARSGYAMPQLAADLRTVIDATSPDEPVHLAAHDWGSIQSWEAVTDPAMRDRLSSYTSISGPSLDMAAEWLRKLPDHPREGLRQLLASYYVFAFQLPFLPELAAKYGVLDTLVNQSASIGVAAPDRPDGKRSQRDLVNGLELYRANMMGRLAKPGRRSTTVSTQVIAPKHDVHVTVPLQTEAPAPYCTDLHTRVVDGNHWVVAQQPAMIAGMIAEFARYADGGPLPDGLG
jgi:pimeloyl-ACP methyl ester carboxylesterase